MSRDLTKLEEATNDELIGELAQRLDAVVVIGVRPRRGKDEHPTADYYLVRWTGGEAHVMGLCEYGREVIRRYIWQDDGRR